MEVARAGWRTIGKILGSCVQNRRFSHECNDESTRRYFPSGDNAAMLPLSLGMFYTFYPSERIQ